MPVFENRTGAYFWVREDRKRRKLAFAGQHQLNVDWSYPVKLVSLQAQLRYARRPLRSAALTTSRFRPR